MIFFNKEFMHWHARKWTWIHSITLEITNILSIRGDASCFEWQLPIYSYMLFLTWFTFLSNRINIPIFCCKIHICTCFNYSIVFYTIDFKRLFKKPYFISCRCSIIVFNSVAKNTHNLHVTGLERRLITRHSSPK